ATPESTTLLTEAVRFSSRSQQDPVETLRNRDGDQVRERRAGVNPFHEFAGTGHGRERGLPRPEIVAILDKIVAVQQSGKREHEASVEAETGVHTSEDHQLAANRRGEAHTRRLER